MIVSLTWYIRLQHVPSTVPCRTTVRVVVFDLHFVRILVHIVQCVQRHFFVQRKPTRLADGAFVQRAYSCQTLNVHRCFAFAIRSRLALFHAHVTLFFSFKHVSILVFFDRKGGLGRNGVNGMVPFFVHPINVFAAFAAQTWTCISIPSFGRAQLFEAPLNLRGLSTKPSQSCFQSLLDAIEGPSLWLLWFWWRVGIVGAGWWDQFQATLCAHNSKINEFFLNVQVIEFVQTVGSVKVVVVVGVQCVGHVVETISPMLEW